MKKKMKVRFADIRYTDKAYNPEGINSNRTYRYIIDGDGKERIVVEEETEEIDTDNII